MWWQRWWQFFDDWCYDLNDIIKLHNFDFLRSRWWASVHKIWAFPKMQHNTTTLDVSLKWKQNGRFNWIFCKHGKWLNINPERTLFLRRILLLKTVIQMIELNMRFIGKPHDLYKAICDFRKHFKSMHDFNGNSILWSSKLFNYRF